MFSSQPLDLSGRIGLAECGWGAGRARHTYLGAQYARLSHRRGKKKAVLAVGHSILVRAYYVLQRETTYEEPGADYFVERDRAALERRHVRALERLGYRVTLDTPAA